MTTDHLGHDTVAERRVRNVTSHRRTTDLLGDDTGQIGVAVDDGDLGASHGEATRSRGAHGW